MAHCDEYFGAVITRWFESERGMGGIDAASRRTSHRMFDAFLSSSIVRISISSLGQNSCIANLKPSQHNPQ